MKKVLVRGPVLSQSGYGEQARFALRAMRRFPDVFDIYILTTPWGQTGWVWEDNEERRWIDATLAKSIAYMSQGEGGAFDICLQITIPPEWEKMAPVNVGYTAGIESTKMDASWMQPCMDIDRIITVSEHAAYAIRNTEYNAVNNQTQEQFIAKVTTPVHVVGYAARHVEADPLDLDLEHDFNFLVIAQWGPRKNMENTIKWFVEEFYDKKVGLLVKLNSIKNCYMDREMTENRLKALLQEYPDRKCGVYLLHGDLTEKQVASLYTHPKIKCLVNLAHGEGYGLPMFEAALNGMPVITPAWGGQNDFLS